MKIFHGVSTATKARVACPILRAWLASLRYRFVVDDPGALPWRIGRPAIYVFWHEAMLMLAHAHVRDASPLISRGRDGDFISAVVERFGGRAVRGSTDHDGKDRGGRAALREMIRQGRTRHLAIPVDGPVGPRRVASAGAVVLAGQTGMPLVPLGLAAGSALEVGPSGREIMLPVPGTRVWAAAGAPMHVPPDLPRDRRGAYTALLQAAMDAVTSRVEGYARGARPPVRPIGLRQLRSLR
jgi:lysophospholipid acyltransferase (LPLAT)-like uncharacterized protein